MKRCLLVLFVLAFTFPVMHCQTDNTIYVRNFAGNTVGAKVAAAQLTCGPNVQVPCILVLDASLAAFQDGVMPTLCSHCYLWDFRSGPPNGSYTLPTATTTRLGGVKPDGTTCTTNSSTGVLTCPGSGGGSAGPAAAQLATAGSNISLSGEQVVDGTLTSSSRVLVKDQTTASQNGCYVSSSGAWARCSDFATPVNGTMIYVSGGRTHFDTTFVVTSPNPITVGTSAINFYASSAFSPAGPPQGPCDLLAAAGNPCKAAYSFARRMFASYAGNLFQLTRASDSTTTNIGTLSSGIVNVPAIISFCAGTTCTVTEIYDQTGLSSNNLVNWNAGGDLTAVVPTIGFTTMPSGLVLPVLRIPPGVDGVSSSGYSTASGTSGLPEGNSPITVYMLAENYSEGGQISGCCGSFGDTENPVRNNGSGHMFSVTWGSGTSGRLSTSTNTGLGPWVGVDLENGVFFAGGTPYQNYLCVIEKYDTSGTALTLKDGDATQGRLQTIYAGALPPGYTMDMEGNITLGMGGDGTPAPINFTEGAIISSATSDATDNALQANFAAFFGPQQTAPPFVPQQNYTYSIGGYAPLATAVLPAKGVPGVLYTVINGLTATDCTAGGGTDVHQCYWNVLTASYLSLKSAGGSMVYPSAGVPISTGSAWGTSKPPAGSGAGYTTGPTSSTSGDAATYSGTGGQLQDAGFTPAPALACTSTIPGTAANNGCYNVTSSASMAMPSASAFTAFTASVNTGQTLTLTGTSFEYTVDCGRYTSGSTVSLVGSQKILVQSDGTNTWATCAAESLGALETSGSPFAVNGGINFYWEAASGDFSWLLSTPPALPRVVQQCFGKSRTDEYVISIIPPSGVTIWYGGSPGTSGSSTGLVSSGTQTDYICLVSVGATEYQAIGPGVGGTPPWTNH